MVFKAFLISSCMLFAGTAVAQVSAPECEAQMADILRTSVDCTVTLKSDTEQSARLSDLTRGLISEVTCTFPLSFPKSRIYATFITDTQVRLPALELTCSVLGAVTVTTVLQPSCDKTGNTWTCAPNMSGTSGLGFVGSVLENRINSSDTLKNEMGQALTRLSQ